jgi:hypothetical protein
LPTLTFAAACPGLPVAFFVRTMFASNTAMMIAGDSMSTSATVM